MRRILTAFVLIFALLLTGCAGEVPDTVQEVEATPSASPTPKQTPFSLPYYPDASLHPITSDNRTNLVVCSLVYEGLLELDHNFTPHGVLCESYSASEDGLTWNFTLKAATFSDGTALTAGDVAASLELARTSPLYAARLADVHSVSAGEDGTVTITLSRPNTALPALLDIPVVRDMEDGSLPLGTGPYTFVEDSGPLRLARRSTAPGTAPEEIPLLSIQSVDDLIYAFDAGDISLVVSDLTGANALGYSSGYEAFAYPTTTMLYVGFQAKSGPCKDPLIRQAISRSFDRDTVTVSLLAGHAQASCLPVSPRSALYSATLAQAGAFSPTAAQELLDQAGCTLAEDGTLRQGRTALTLTFIVNTDNSFKLTIAEYLAEQLRGLGFEVALQKLSWDDYVAALERGNFDLYLAETTLTADFDLSPLIGSSGSLNYGAYANPDTDALLEQLKAAPEAQRTRAAAEALKQFQADAPLAVLCFKSHSVLTQWRAVSGLTPTRQDPFYGLEHLRFSAE